MINQIRLLTPDDLDIVQPYLDKDPIYNIYLIDGLHTYGLNNAQAQFWGSFRRGRLAGVLFINVLADYPGASSYGCLAGDDANVLGRLAKFSVKRDVILLKGKKEYIEPAAKAIVPKVKQSRLTSWNLYKAGSGDNPHLCDYPVRLATPDDLPAVVELYKDFEYGSHDLRQIAFEAQQAINKTTCFVVELDG